MSADDYFVAGDLHALRMESELLTLENTFLKARLSALERELKRAQDREASLRNRLEQPDEPQPS